MFPNTSLDELTSDKVYEFKKADFLYLTVLKYYSQLYDYPLQENWWKDYSQEKRSGRIWWTMNEAWAEYGTLNPNIPYRWLSIAKRALYWDHLPSNFHPWALAILEKFDLPRYQAAYQFPAEEYEAMARDLPDVLQGLRNYPLDKLAPPIDENNWGFTDQ
jgi:hypothetical protein